MSNAKKINVYSLDGKFLRQFESISDLWRKAKDVFGCVLNKDYIVKVCKGEKENYKNLIFKFVES